MQFTGKERDAETGLDYFEARYLSSAQGRFTSPDRVKVTPERLRDPQQFNLYAYARNKPLRFIDPTGQVLQIAGDVNEAQKQLCELLGTSDCSSRISYNSKTNTITVNFAGISNNEGALLLGQLVDSQNVYNLTLGDQHLTAAGLKSLGNEAIVNNSNSFDPPRFSIYKPAGVRPPAGVDSLVAINPANARFLDSQGRKVALSSTIFHELAEAYSKVDLGKPYISFEFGTVRNGMIVTTPSGFQRGASAPLHLRMRFTRRLPKASCTLRDLFSRRPLLDPIIRAGVSRKHIMRYCSHYLHEAYIDAFTDAQGLLWVYDRHEHEVRAIPPRVVGKARGFYQYKRPDGITFDLEHHPWLNARESSGIALLPHVLTGSLSPEERLSFAQYIALSAFRTPAYQACMLKAILRDHTTASDSDLDHLRWEYRRAWGNDVAHISGAGRTIAMNPRLHVRQIIAGVTRHAPTIAGLTWRVLHTTTSAFLTSDNPVTIVVPGGGFPPQRYLLDPAQDLGQRIVFPLTPQYCLLLRHGDASFDVLSVEEELTREINGYVVNDALRYVLAPQERFAGLLPIGTTWARGTAPSTTPDCGARAAHCSDIAVSVSRVVPLSAG